MKKNNNIKQLKAMVNADYLETVECVKYGVQAYNISANEYEVIVKFVKENGRYYFVDRKGNKYLVSRYDRAELVARDILDNLRYAEETAYKYVCALEEKKQISVESAYVPMFFDFCDLFGFDVESVEMHFHDNGEVFTVYRLKSEQTAKDDAQSEETENGEQDNENGENGSENKENGSENEETAAACEPSAFSGILAKAETAAAKVKAFFSILAKMEWYSFILFGPSLVMLGVVANCIYLLASGACPDMGRAVENIVLFGFLAFAFAFGGFVMASDEWDEAKKEVLIRNK